METLFAHFQAFFAVWGLLAVFVVLLLENFGVPLPGELALLYAGFHVSTQGTFSLSALILVATLACVAGDNLGYEFGLYYGNRARRWLHISAARGATFEAYFQHHGAATIFFARFVAGLRIFAGPLAGVYHMRRRAFVVYNFLGALVWTVVVSTAGALLGVHWRRLLRFAGRVDLVIFLVAAVLIVVAWWRLRGEPHD
ncbi:MAG: DedA family protein [Terriglobales bacterium]